MPEGVRDGGFPPEIFCAALDQAAYYVQKAAGQKALTIVVVEGENPGELETYSDSGSVEKVEFTYLARVLIRAALQCLQRAAEQEET